MNCLLLPSTFSKESEQEKGKFQMYSTGYIVILSSISYDLVFHS